MNQKLMLALYLYVASVCSAPMQMQVLPWQYGNGIQPQFPFMRQMVPNMQTPTMPMYPQQPMIVILPNTAPNTVDNRYVNLNEPDAKIDLKSNTGHVDVNKDAVVIDANPKAQETQTRNAVVYLPEEGRYSVGQIISYIPFLPVEINVPDTISWITSLLTGGWFRPQGPLPSENLKRQSNKGPMPVIVMPYPGSMPQI